MVINYVSNVITGNLNDSGGGELGFIWSFHFIMLSRMTIHAFSSAHDVFIALCSLCSVV